MPGPDGVAFLPARPVIPAGLATLAGRVRRRFVGWFLRKRLLDAEAAADMLARENTGFSVDASVRIVLVDRDVPSYFKSLEHLLRYCGRPAFALERLSREDTDWAEWHLANDTPMRDFSPEGLAKYKRYLQLAAAGVL